MKHTKEALIKDCRERQKVFDQIKELAAAEGDVELVRDVDELIKLHTERERLLADPNTEVVSEARGG